MSDSAAHLVAADMAIDQGNMPAQCWHLIWANNIDYGTILFRGWEVWATDFNLVAKRLSDSSAINYMVKSGHIGASTFPPGEGRSESLAVIESLTEYLVRRQLQWDIYESRWVEPLCATCFRTRSECRC